MGSAQAPQGCLPPRNSTAPCLTHVLLEPARGFSPTRLSTWGSPAMPACPRESGPECVCQPSWPALCRTRVTTNISKLSAGIRLQGCMLSTQQTSQPSGACSWRWSQATVPLVQGQLRQHSLSVRYTPGPCPWDTIRVQVPPVPATNQACAEFLLNPAASLCPFYR